MLRKSGIILVMLVAVTILVMASASAASVSGVTYLTKAPHIVTKAGDGGYTAFTPSTSAANNNALGAIKPMSISSGITQGQTIWAQKSVSGFYTNIGFDLYWGNPSNSLQMTIYTPDGYVYGPFSDSSTDGRLNGDIPYGLQRQSGIAQGTYYIKIYGDRVSGTQSFTVY